MKTIKGNGRIRVLVLLVLSGLGDAPGLHEEPEWVQLACEDHEFVEGPTVGWEYDCNEKRWVNLGEEE